MGRKSVTASVGVFLFLLITSFAGTPLYAACDDACQAYFREEGRALREAEEARYRELLQTDEEFADAERTYLQTKVAFLDLFTDETQPAIERFFMMAGQSLGYRTYFTEGDGKAFQQRFIKSRKEITAYMQQVIGNRDRPLALLYLVQTIGERGFFYTHQNDAMRDFAAIDFDRTRPLPGGGMTLEGDFKRFYHGDAPVDYPRRQDGAYAVSYEIYPFADQTWGIVRSEGTSQVILMRWIDGEKTALFTLPSFSMNDLYPSGKPVRCPGEPDPEDRLFPSDQPVFCPGDIPVIKEHRVAVTGCELRPVYDVDMTLAPPVVTAKIEQKETDKLSYYCVPECSLPYVWNGTTFRPDVKNCLPVGQWGVFSPFADSVLLPFEVAYRSLMERDDRLAAHNEVLVARWKEYSALFAGDSRTLVEDIGREWMFLRQIALYPHRMKDDFAFTDAIVAYDQAVVEYMETVSDLMKSPDARLLMALDPLHRIIELRSGKDNMPQGLSLDAGPLTEQAYIATLFAHELDKRTQLLRGGDLPPPAAGGEENAEDDYPCEPVVTLTGSMGGDSIVYENTTSYNYGCHGSSERRTYTVRRAKGKKGAIWGISTWDANYSTRESDAITRENRITMIDGGKIHLLTPSLPDPVLFGGGREPEASQKETAMQANGRDYDACILRPALVADTAKIPFGLKAVLLQTNPSSYNGTWQCAPQCAVPYRWNKAKKRYEPGKPDCLPDGKWGVTEP